MSNYKYKELNSYHNSLQVHNTEVGESISLQKRMSNGKKKFLDAKNLATRHQHHIFGTASMESSE